MSNKECEMHFKLHSSYQNKSYAEHFSRALYRVLFGGVKEFDIDKIKEVSRGGITTRFYLSSVSEKYFHQLQAILGTSKIDTALVVLQEIDNNPNLYPINQEEMAS